MNDLKFNEAATAFEADMSASNQSFAADFRDVSEIKGEKGDSAYAIAVADGFDGTEAEWLASLKGEKGDKGEQGVQGVQGVRGEQGIQGEQGVQGIQGEKGDKGEQGVQGIPGVSVTHEWNGTTLQITSASGTTSADLKGEKGDTGATGPQGEQGVQGEKGEKGDKGDKGDTGATGPQGEKGDTGEQGPKGADGTMTFEDLTAEQKESLRGPQGIQGEKGDTGEKGADGAPATHAWNGTVLTVTSASGTSSADLKGEKGDKGDIGPQGEQGAPGTTDYNELQNKPIQRIESLDTSNLVNLRDLESGQYIIYGYFSPYANSDISMSADNSFISVIRKTAGSHIICLDPLNAKAVFFEILVDESEASGFKYTRTIIPLLDLYALLSEVGSIAELTTADKTSVVAAINELVSNTLAKTALPAAIDNALAQAKASGEFDGSDGKDGSNGSDGVGISSIQQTTTSTADGGSNIFTVTLTNGTSATFTVQNGSRGSDGAAGKDGPAYTLTETDKNTIAAAVKASLTTKALVFTYEDGTTNTLEVYVK